MGKIVGGSTIFASFAVQLSSISKDGENVEINSDQFLTFPFIPVGCLNGVTKPFVILFPFN